MTNWIAKVWLLGLVMASAPAHAQDSVMTLAGQALVSGATNGVGTNALFNDPAGMISDSAGNLYIADSQNHVIRKLATNGVVTTFAGKLGTSGSDNGTITQARFDTPSGIAIDSAGSLFVSDTGNHTIRKITTAGAVSTIAGLAGQSGFTNAIGTSARFNSPLGIAVTTNGVVYVADCGNHLIRTISTGGAVSTLAGAPETWGTNDGIGATARFNGPVGLALDNDGNLFVSDSNNHTIRKIAPDGSAITWAGVAGIDGYVDGERLTARFAKPAELTFDAHGNLFVADSFNHVIRKISSDGVVTTVTGFPRSHGSSDGMNGQARLFNPYGLAVSPRGSLTVADTYNELIRAVLVPFSVDLEALNGISSVTILWQSEIGRTYQVQYRSGLDSQSWTNLGAAIPAEGLVSTQADNTTDPSGQRLYRVIAVQ